ncbi:hypothetical protein BKA69DRAFT_687682 [Paraphysoderma sedebokerense]|nr:hypothetical protein BKA69DRAFT_687682 [Paraphysoderma sedebokerense]
MMLFLKRKVQVLLPPFVRFVQSAPGQLHQKIFSPYPRQTVSIYPLYFNDMDSDILLAYKKIQEANTVQLSDESLVASVEGFCTFSFFQSASIQPRCNTSLGEKVRDIGRKDSISEISTANCTEIIDNILELTTVSSVSVKLAAEKCLRLLANFSIARSIMIKKVENFFGLFVEDANSSTQEIRRASLYRLAIIYQIVGASVNFTTMSLPEVVPNMLSETSSYLYSILSNDSYNNIDIEDRRSLVLKLEDFILELLRTYIAENETNHPRTSQSSNQLLTVVASQFSLKNDVIDDEVLQLSSRMYPLLVLLAHDRDMSVVFLHLTSTISSLSPTDSAMPIAKLHLVRGCLTQIRFLLQNPPESLTVRVMSSLFDVTFRKIKSFYDQQGLDASSKYFVFDSTDIWLREIYSYGEIYPSSAQLSTIFQFLLNSCEEPIKPAKKLLSSSFLHCLKMMTEEQINDLLTMILKKSEHHKVLL